MLLLAGLAGFLLLDSPWNVIVVCAAALVELGEVAFWLRLQRRWRVQTGAEGMVGARGEAIESFSAGVGRVRVLGESWSARSAMPLEAGQRIRVVAVDGLSVEVEPTEKGP